MKTIGGCSHSRQRVLFLRFPADLGEKQEKTIIIARQSIKKQRHHFAAKVCIVKAMVFTVVMYTWESWTMKKADH